MAVIENWYNQDLQDSVRVHYLNGNLFSHNGNGNRIGVHVFNNGEPVTLTGTVSGYVVLSDGTTVPCVGDKSSNSAWILIPAAAYQPGTVFITIFLTDGTTVTTLASVSTSVLIARTSTQVDPGSVVTDWTQTINAAMQEVETAAENVAGMVADYYSALTFPVPLGKYCIYNNVLYRCISPIASSESWTAAHWTQVKLANEVSNLSNEISDVKSALYSYNSMNRIPIKTTGQDTHGITFTPNMDWSYTVSGTADSNGVNYSLISGNGNFPYGIGAGDSFKISYNGYSKVKLQLYRYINGSLESNVWKETIGEWTEEPVTLGSTVTGLMIRLRVLANVAITTPVTVMPTIMTTKTNKELSNELAELQIAYNSGEYQSASDAVHAQFGSLLNAFNHDFSNDTLIPWSIVSSTGKWTTSSTQPFRSYCIEIPKNVVSIKVTAGQNNTFFALLDTYSYPPTSGEYPDYSDGTGRIAVAAGTSASYMIADNMNYMFVGAINSSGGEMLPTVTMYAPKGSIIDVEGIAYLQPTGDQTDRTDEIEALLTATGICNLGNGDFYVSGIEMPSGSIIRGCGKSTRVIMVSGVSSGAVIKMASNCTVSDVTIRGSASGISVSSTVRNLHGILWEGTYTSISGDGEAPTRGTISNVYILYCKGGGITCHGTGTGISNCLNVVNTFINTCDAGINIDFLSEFHRFTNVDCRGCYYGCVDNGGNNTFSNCGFSKNMVGLLMDDSNGQSPNNSHGTFSNCVFNHSGSNNDGYAMRILGMDSGEVFVGCQVFYGKIEVNDSNGILFSSCNIKSGTSFEFTNASVIFVGNVFGGQPTKTETGTNTITVANSYLRDGTPVVFQNAT